MKGFLPVKRICDRAGALDAEIDRVVRGYPADIALQKHGATIDDEILRSLMSEPEASMAKKPNAEILPFLIPAKPDK